MVTLKEALKLPKEEIFDLRIEIKQKIEATKNLGAYVEQFTGKPLSEYGEGIPIAIKDNIQVNGWEVTSGSNILQGYIASSRVNTN